MTATPSNSWRCPVCGQPGLVETYKPLCSQRCQNVDLHRWLTGKYVFEVDDAPDEDELNRKQD